MNSQYAFGDFDHDSLQYHFYCDELVGAGRLFSTRTLEHGSIWLFDGSQFHELKNVTGKFDHASQETLDVEMEGLRFFQKDTEIRITYEGEDGSSGIEIRLRPDADIQWNDTISNVIHQPNMDVELRWNGKTRYGTGYCKRYSWSPAPNHWGYRFIQGFLDGGEISIWTAEATFGTGKYDYFKMRMPDGEVITTPKDISCHRQNGAFAQSSIGLVEIQLEERALWQVPLRSDAMDSLLRQRACKMTVRTNQWEKQGFAINETCYGTLG